MNQKGSSDQKKESSKVKSKPVRKSAARLTFAASPHNDFISAGEGRQSDENTLLQRQCACGNHTTSSGECPDCEQELSSGSLQRTAVTGEPFLKTAQPKPATRTGPGSAKTHDLSRIPTYSPKGSTQIIQGSFAVNPPGDRFEIEADRVAGAVTQFQAPAIPSALTGVPGLTQRSPAVPGLPAISRIQASGAASTAHVSPNTEARINQMQGGGQALPDQSRSYFEDRMGYDFSNVRIHTDANAVQASRDIQAKAFTTSNHIAFASGAYQPGTDAGRFLLAHELTHVAQQGAAPLQKKPNLSSLKQRTTKSDVLSHLQTLQRQPGLNPSLYRKEIAAFQQNQAHQGSNDHQWQISDHLETANIQQKDGDSQVLRRDDDDEPAAKPTLSFSTVVGPNAFDCGGFRWGAQWSVNGATDTTNGWVVQKVEINVNVKDADDNDVDIAAKGSLNTSWYPLWEAWQVREGVVYIGRLKSTHNADTYGSPAVGEGTKGSLQVKGTAEYYDDLTLPASFTVSSAAPTWALPATKSTPTLTGGTGSLDHSLTATWDCTTGTDKTTTITHT